MIDLHDDLLFAGRTFERFYAAVGFDTKTPGGLTPHRFPIDYRVYPEMPHNIAVILSKRYDDLGDINISFCHAHNLPVTIGWAILKQHVGLSNYVIGELSAKREVFFKRITESSPWFADLFLWNKI